MTHAGIQVTSDMIFENTLTREKGRKTMQHLFDKNNMPDAIFSASDFSALGALLTLKENSIAVPEQIGIAGFANEPFTELSSPSITSLEQHSEEMGKSAARLLIEQIESTDSKRISRVLTFKPGLIIRESTQKQK
jgi:LacI family transcriptional regulator